MSQKAGEDVVVYWDLVALWNLALDYFLLLCSAKLAGVDVARRRLLIGAIFGAAYAAVGLFMPRSVFFLFLGFVLLCAAAYCGTGQGIRLSLLFLLLCCAFAGAVLLLGRSERLRRGLFFGELPWGVFFLAAVSCYILLCVIFRGGARYRANDFVQAEICHGGKTVTLRLLCDTGNTLTLDGKAVPVVEKAVLFDVGETRPISYTAVGVEGELESFFCDELFIDGRSLGRRCIALSPTPLGDEFQGLWCAKEEGNA